MDRIYNWTLVMKCSHVPEPFQQGDNGWGGQVRCQGGGQLRKPTTWNDCCICWQIDTGTLTERWRDMVQRTPPNHFLHIFLTIFQKEDSLSHGDVSMVFCFAMNERRTKQRLLISQAHAQKSHVAGSLQYHLLKNQMVIEVMVEGEHDQHH